ncbi:MAG: hypothetical protein KF912_01780 [Phycisphaeraceae bacterium]|nr:hypothetical protein [Phycisphaeraceae bacterium]MBX3366030.1 hypothetical protein [Phycisphaeraceae bacterium]QYK48530.1 MAG: hypothetical protein KF838_01435 [Phycisphaeraceae bacterium]
MRSVRLDADTERLLAEASRTSGLHASEIIRTGTREKCDEILKTSLKDRLSYFIGAVAVDGTDARNSGREFSKSLLRSHDRKRRRNKP